MPLLIAQDPRLGAGGAGAGRADRCADQNAGWGRTARGVPQEATVANVKRYDAEEETPADE